MKAQLARQAAELADLKARPAPVPAASLAAAPVAAATAAPITTIPDAVAHEIQELQSAINTLQLRLELRESELLRAERAVAQAHSAAEAVIAERFVAMLQAKDAALTAARQEITTLMQLMARMHGADGGALLDGALAEGMAIA